MKQHCGEIVRAMLGRRILSVNYYNTVSVGDIYRVVIQLDDGSHIDIGGKPGLAVRLRPLLSEGIALFFGNPDVFINEGDGD